MEMTVRQKTAALVAPGATGDQRLSRSLRARSAQRTLGRPAAAAVQMLLLPSLLLLVLQRRLLLLLLMLLRPHPTRRVSALDARWTACLAAALFVVFADARREPPIVAAAAADAR